MSDDNPLALGAHYCPRCGAQLDSDKRPCPMPHDEEGQ